MKKRAYCFNERLNFDALKGDNVGEAPKEFVHMHQDVFYPEENGYTEHKQWKTSDGQFIGIAKHKSHDKFEVMRERELDNTGW